MSLEVRWNGETTAFMKSHHPQRSTICDSWMYVLRRIATETSNGFGYIFLEVVYYEQIFVSIGYVGQICRQSK